MEIQFSPGLMETALIQFSPIDVRFRCDSIASFGRPVVPEVWIISAVSLAFPGAVLQEKFLRSFFQQLTLFQQLAERDQPRIIL